MLRGRGQQCRALNGLLTQVRAGRSRVLVIRGEPGIGKTARCLPQRQTAGTRALFILAGLVSVALGVVLFSGPVIGAFTLALLFGLFSLSYGVSLIVIGVQERRTGQTRPEPAVGLPAGQGRS